MSYLDWKVGDKVVCIKRAGWNLNRGEQGPVFGEVYTIRDITSRRSGKIYLRFEEIRNPEIYDEDEGDNDCKEARFWIARFRPVQTRKTDISVFTDILRKAEREIEDAPMQVQLG